MIPDPSGKTMVIGTKSNPSIPATNGNVSARFIILRKDRSIERNRFLIPNTNENVRSVDLFGNRELLPPSWHLAKFRKVQTWCDLDIPNSQMHHCERFTLLDL